MDIILVDYLRGRSAVVERIINRLKKNDRRARVDSRQLNQMLLQGPRDGAKVYVVAQSANIYKVFCAWP